MARTTVIYGSSWVSTWFHAASRGLKFIGNSLLDVAGEVAWLLPVVAFIAGSVALFHVTVQSGVYKVKAPGIEGMEVPAWLSGGDMVDLMKKVKVVEGRSLYDPKVAVDLAKAFGRNPWISEVSYVRRRFPCFLDCEIAIRKPFAAVEAGKKLFVVDRAGCRLPVPVSDTPPLGLPIIVGVRSFPPAPGEAWTDSAVIAGLLVLSKTADLAAVTGNSGLRIVGAEIGSRKGLPTVVLHTAIGTRIEWGVVYRPGCEPYGVPLPEERVEAVRKVVARLGAGMVEMVDVSVLPPSYKARR